MERPGTAGPTGTTGATGTSGAPGATGPIGTTGATGIAGTAGTTGPAGATGSTGPTGLPGLAGVEGQAGPKGEKGTAGNTGPAGPKGETGAAGPGGSSGSSAYAEFYALMPPDNAATVALPRPPVEFPRNGPAMGAISRPHPGRIPCRCPAPVRTVSTSRCPSPSPGSLVIALDAGGVTTELHLHGIRAFARQAPDCQISGDALVTTTVTNSTIELRNPVVRNTPALTITPARRRCTPAPPPPPS